MNEVDIAAPHSDINVLTALDVANGSPISPLERLKIFNSDDWEDVTLELVTHWKTQYSRVVRCGSGGDMGRDVIAYSHTDPSIWENFQCKHYKSKLSLAQGLVEIAKLFYYSQLGEFTLPTHYYFVAPQGISNDFLRHLNDPAKLKNALTSRWDKDCKNNITKKDGGAVELTGDLLHSIKSADFSIFDHLPPIKIIELHSLTHFNAKRFGGTMRRRPSIPEPPDNVSENEIIYINELLRAFADADGVKEILVSSLVSGDDYKEEYDSARKNFYAAEGLQKFSRDWLPDNCYEELIEECFEGVSPTIRSKFENGYARYLATNSQAVRIAYSSHPLNPYMKIQDKKGLCHQLVISRGVKWVKE